MKRFLITMLVLVMSVSIFVLPAQAAEAVTATIPVNLTLTGSRPATADVFSIILEAKNASNPMPQGAVNGKYTLPMSDDGTGADTANLVISFDRVGIYEYSVHQQDLGDPDCYQDGSIYDMTIYITNTPEGGLAINVAIYRRGDETATKCDIVFGNRYANPTTVPLTAIKTLNSKTPKDNSLSSSWRIRTARKWSGSTTRARMWPSPPSSTMTPRTSAPIPTPCPR